MIHCRAFEPIKARLEKATFDSQSRRLFHGRGRCFKGLEHVCIDWFSPSLVTTLFDFVDHYWERDFLNWLASQVPSGRSVYVQRRYQDQPCYEHMLGPELTELYAQRGMLKFVLQLKNQNIGFFLDIDPARCWLEKNCKGKRVLNLFSYTCSFSVVASASGARSVLNMDLSSKSLSLGWTSYHKNDLSLDGVQFFANDILKSWSRLKRFGPYDLVIIDPPSFQKGSFIEKKDYAKVLRRMVQLTSPDAKLLCSLNSPEVTARDFKQRLDDCLDDFSYAEQLSPSEDFPTLDPEQALKMFVYKR